VISYNYDILADNALFLNHKMNEKNHLVPFGKVYYQGEWMDPRESVSNVKMLKLHGSLNWLSIDRSDAYILGVPFAGYLSCQTVILNLPLAFVLNPLASFD
jgi:hypothetical protein